MWGEIKFIVIGVVLAMILAAGLRTGCQALGIGYATDGVPLNEMVQIPCPCSRCNGKRPANWVSHGTYKGVDCGTITKRFTPVPQ